MHCLLINASVANYAPKRKTPELATKGLRDTCTLHLTACRQLQLSIHCVGVAPQRVWQFSGSVVRVAASTASQKIPLLTVMLQHVFCFPVSEEKKAIHRKEVMRLHLSWGERCDHKNCLVMPCVNRETKAQIRQKFSVFSLSWDNVFARHQYIIRPFITCEQLITCHHKLFVFVRISRPPASSAAVQISHSSAYMAETCRFTSSCCKGWIDCEFAFYICETNKSYASISLFPTFVLQSRIYIRITSLHQNGRPVTVTSLKGFVHSQNQEKQGRFSPLALYACLHQNSLRTELQNTVTVSQIGFSNNNTGNPANKNSQPQGTPAFTNSSTGDKKGNR